MLANSVLGAVSVCSKDVEAITSPIKLATGDENLVNQQSAQPEQPLVRRCLPLVNTSGCNSTLYMCIVGLLPSGDHAWKEWAGVSQVDDASAEIAEQVTSQLATDMGYSGVEWRFVECKARRGVQTALQSSGKDAVRLFASCLNAKGWQYDQLCGNNFVAPTPATAAATMTR